MTKQLKDLPIHVNMRHEDYCVALHEMHEAFILYNFANFLVRQAYFYYSNNKYGTTYQYQWTGVKELDDWIKSGKTYAGNMNNLSCLRVMLTKHLHLHLNSKMADGVLRNLANNWQSYYGSKNAGLEAEIPKYKRGGYSCVPVNNQAISSVALAEGVIKPAGFKKGLQLPKDFDPSLVKSCEIVMKNGKVWLHVHYFDTEISDYKPGNVIAAIDFGVNNIVAMSYSDQSSPIVIADKRIKTWNQEWNKTKAAKQRGNDKYWSKSLDKVTSKRNLRVDQIIHRIANVVISEAMKHGVGTLILGKNDGWKQNVNLGKKNNQNFVQIPFAKIANNIAYKAGKVGITVFFQEESYTSKASFISQDPIPVYDENDKTKHVFSGKRKYRGLYVDGDVQIHADTNAAFNIMRKNQPNDAIKIWGGKKNIQPLGIKLYA